MEKGGLDVVVAVVVMVTPHRECIVQLPVAPCGSRGC